MLIEVEVIVSGVPDSETVDVEVVESVGTALVDVVAEIDAEWGVFNEDEVVTVSAVVDVVYTGEVVAHVVADVGTDAVDIGLINTVVGKVEVTVTCLVAVVD